MVVMSLFLLEGITLEPFLQNAKLNNGHFPLPHFCAILSRIFQELFAHVTHAQLLEFLSNFHSTSRIHLIRKGIYCAKCSMHMIAKKVKHYIFLNFQLEVAIHFYIQKRFIAF